MHRSFFERLTPAQFLQLLELGERQVLPDGARLTTEREVCSKLYFVERGAAKLKYRGDDVAIIGRGGFVNDVAFQQGVGSSAYGTVECVGEVRRREDSNPRSLTCANAMPAPTNAAAC